MIGAELDLTTSMPLDDAINLSLMTKRGSFWQNTEFGSDLHLLDRLTPDTPKRAEGMIKSALSWLVSLGRLRDLTISVTVPRASMLLIAIKATGVNGQPLSLSMFVPVGVVP